MLFNDRLIADAGHDQTAITTRGSTRRSSRSSKGPVADRYLNVLSPYNSYLVPNFNSPNMEDVNVRKALAVALDLNAIVKALGGEKAAAPGETIVNPGVAGSAGQPRVRRGQQQRR